jgi:phenylpropionate dioxygenase-like ring-hydroxylating dioxygenase large terminal subunit
MNSPADHWYVAARTDQLKRGVTLARRILGRRVVLFRDAFGKAVALEDRCPHKNVSLSLGSVRDGQLECRYHGWTFDGAGACTGVPCHAPNEELPKARVRSFPVIEQDDWVWLYVGSADEAAQDGFARLQAGPPSYPKARDLGWFELHNVMKAPLDLILENGLDCSHTGFVHEGLFRSRPQQFVRAKIIEKTGGVLVDTSDEGRSETRDVRMFMPKKQNVVHTDEMILPHTVKVDYWIGKGTHIVTVLVATPEDEHTTRVYTRMGVRYGRLTWIAKPFIELLTRVIVRQDKRILENQAETIRHHGGRSFTLVEADQPTAWMQRSLKQHARGLPAPARLRETEVSYRL